MSQELIAVLTQLERERGVSKDVLLDTLKVAMASAAKKQYGLGKNVDVSFDEQTGEIDVKAAKEVVRIIQNPQSEILLDEARKENPDIQVGDFLSTRCRNRGFGQNSRTNCKASDIAASKRGRACEYFPGIQRT